jgi:hypothetical protein
MISCPLGISRVAITPRKRDDDDDDDDDDDGDTNHRYANVVLCKFSASTQCL